MKNLTDRQREVLDYIAQYTEENGYPPTVRETSERFGVSLRAIQDRIAGLQKKGYLSLSEKKSRSLRVLIDERTDKKNAFVAKLAVFAVLFVMIIVYGYYGADFNAADFIYGRF